MLKHMLNTTNGGIANRVSRPDSSMVVIDQGGGGGGGGGGGAHRFRSPNNLNTSRTSQQFPLNVSHLHTVANNLDTSKHSIYSNTIIQPQQQPQPVNISSPPNNNNKALNGGLNISRMCSNQNSTLNKLKSKQFGVKEMLVSLGLLCLVSLLLALLSLIFLLKISPVTASDIRELLRAEQLTVITAEEYVVVYEVTLALCALTLSLNLCCLLVCAIQFLFAVKLVKSPHGGNDRTSKYLQKSSVSRVCAVGGFFISIPVFLTGIILYTFIQFHSTPAIVTSVFIGLGIIFCGCAMVHNVFIWQKEKTNAVKELAAHHSPLPPPTSNHVHNQSLLAHSIVHGNSFMLRPSTTTPPTADNLKVVHGAREASGSVSPTMANAATLDMSSVTTTNSPHELSTLV